MARSREKLLQTAEKLVGRGKLEAAIREYKKVLRDNPDDISILNRVGDLYARLDQNDEAIDLFTKIAESYGSDGFFVKAIAIYKKIIKLDPTRLGVYERLADLYHQQGLINEARGQYQVLADYYSQHDNAAGAIGIYQKMVDLEPDNPSHRAKLAELYHQEKLVEKAMAEYARIAELMLDHGHPEQAARVYERALEVTAEDIPFITDGVLKLKAAGEVGAAARFLAAAVAKNPQAERISHLAGLGSTRSELEATASGVGRRLEPAAPAAPAADDEPPPLTLDDDTPADEPELPDAAPPDSEPPARGIDVQVAGDDDGLFGSEDLELELDDDEDSASLVAPPADMAGDSARRGAAWIEDSAGGLSDETYEFDLDLGADGDELLAGGPSFDLGEEVAGPETAEVDLGAVEPAASLDHELLERTAAEVNPESTLQDEDDLFTEAEVLARYGIEDKAVEKLGELLQRNPRHLDGHRLLIELHLGQDRRQRVADLASRLAELAVETGDEMVWPTLRESLESQDFEVLDDAPGGPRVEDRSPEVASSLVMDDLGSLEMAPSVEIDELEEPEALEETVDGTPSLEMDEGAFVLELEDDELMAGSAPEREPEPELEPEPVADGPAVSVGWDDDEVELELDLDEADEPSLDEPPVVEEPVAEEPVAEKLAAGEPRVEEPVRPAAAARRRSVDVDEALAELTADLLGGRPRRPSRPAPSAAPASEAPPPVSPIPEEPSAAAPPPAAPAAGLDPLRALGDSLREEIEAEPVVSALSAPAARPKAAVAPPQPASSSVAKPQDGTAWLDEITAHGLEARDAPESELFDEDADFFDLGAELEQELTAEGDEDLLTTNAEQSLEEIVEGFKQGVAESLSEEDFDTHFNLGIAYREMGLLDEAIGEFQLAAKSPDYLVPSASLLGLSFLEKGLAEPAIKWYRRGLDAPAISREDHLGLLYDLAAAQIAAGDRETAHETYTVLHGLDAGYRDTADKLAELG